MAGSQADRFRLPVKALVEGGSAGLTGFFELRHHGDRVDSIGGDRLAAARAGDRTPHIALGEEVEREVRRARGLANPCSLRGQMVVEIVVRRRVTDEAVEGRFFEALHPVDEDQQVYVGSPGEC